MSNADEEILKHGPKVGVAKNVWSVGEYFYQRLEAGGEKVAQIVEDDGDGEEGVLGYSDILHKSKVFSGLLRKHGLTSQDTVMTVTGNTLGYAPVFWGAQFVGATVASVHHMHDYDDLLHFLTTIRPRVVFCNEEAESRVRKAVAEDAKEGGTAVIITLDEMLKYLKETSSEEGFLLGKIEDPDTHVACVLYTSGATGKPKCVEITHSEIMRHIDLKCFNSGDNAKEQEVCVNIAGPACISGLMTNLSSINATMMCLLVPNESFTGPGFITSLSKYKVNYITLSPKHLISMLKCTEAGKHNFEHVKSCLVEGAPVSATMQKLAQTKLKIKVTPSYILTEMFGICNPAFGVTDRPGTVGKLADNFVAKIIDVDTGKTLGPGELGELHVKSPHGIVNFRNDLNAFAASYDKDGFLKTGDIGYFDEDGFLYVEGKLNEHVRHNKQLIAAVDIEAILLRHIKVQEVCVIGVHHELEDEHATAIVVLKEGETVSEDELKTLVKNNLHETQWLRGGVIFAGSLPYTLNAKINKQLLRKTYNATGD